MDIKAAAEFGVVVPGCQTSCQDLFLCMCVYMYVLLVVVFLLRVLFSFHQEAWLAHGLRSSLVTDTPVAHLYNGVFKDFRQLCGNRGRRHAYQ